MGFGFDNENLVGKSPFSYTNTDTTSVSSNDRNLSPIVGNGDSIIPDHDHDQGDIDWFSGLGQQLGLLVKD